MKNKNVQIPYELFLLLLQYHLMEYRQNEEKIRQGLEKKMNAMAEREIYSRYKTAPTEEEREKISERISGQERNTRRLSMVTSLLMVL